MEQRVIYLSGFLAGLPNEDLDSLKVLVAAEQEKRHQNHQQRQQVAEAVQLNQQLNQQQKQPLQPQLTPLESNHPLPVVGAGKPRHRKESKAGHWTPSKGSAAIRITDDDIIESLDYGKVGTRIGELLAPIYVTRDIFNKATRERETRQVAVKYEFFYVYKSTKDDEENNTTLIVFPYGCMDFCKAALPILKEVFSSAEIYTGSTKRGAWEY